MSSRAYLRRSQVTKGFSNWKDVFKKHFQSKCHAEAVEAVVTVPRTTRNVRELLSTAHRAEKEPAKDFIQYLLSC